MKKSDAIKIFGHRLIDLGNALGKTKQAISQWADELDEDKTNMVVGAAVLKGKPIPEDVLLTIKSKGNDL